MIVYHHVLSVTPCSTGENLIYDWHVGCPENHLREHQMTCGPLSCVTGRVRCGIGGLCSVVMATFTLLWGGYSTILSARVDPLAALLQLILNTTPHRLSPAQQGAASCCKKTDFLSPTWSCHTTAWKKSNWSMHMAIVSNLRLIFRKACMGGLVMWCLDCLFEELELPLVTV